tara:strand:+ start:4750 stop:5262 length:513 start_codon:yes stop_codon:yes gene_type:complete
MKSLLIFIVTICDYAHSLDFGKNLVVRSIPKHEALIVMKKWCLDIKLIEDSDIPEDGDIDLRVTDDSYSGPFRLIMHEHKENEKINDIRKISNWLSHTRKKNGVYVSIINDDEKMFAFIEKKNKYVQVNGFLAHPFIDTSEHESSRSALALTLLDIASENNEDIFFIFEE